MIIEIIVIAAALVFLAAKLQGKSNEGEKGTPSETLRSQEEAPKEVVRRVLTIEGTEPFKGTASFIKGFGLSPAEVSDVRFFSQEGTSVEGLPPRVQDCLKISYQEGLGRGLEVAGLAQGQRALLKGEALYFALIQRPQIPGFIVAFVAKAQ